MDVFVTVYLFAPSFRHQFDTIIRNTMFSKDKCKHLAKEKYIELQQRRIAPLHCQICLIMEFILINYFTVLRLLRHAICGSVPIRHSHENASEKSWPVSMRILRQDFKNV